MPLDNTDEPLNPYMLPVTGMANTYQAQADSDSGFLTDTANFIGAIPNFGIATAGAAVSDIINSSGAIQKFLGGDGWETDTHDMIDSFDADAADYYTAHKGLVDGTSLVATSIIPGTLGIKALRAAQNGASGNRVLSALGFGIVNPTKLNMARKAAQERAAAASSTWDALTGELGKALALGGASNLLDAAAFGAGAMFATNSSPLYEGMDAFDLVKMTAKDAFIFGGVVGGVFSGAKTFYGLRNAAHVEDMKTIVGRNIDTGSDFDAPSLRIAQTIGSYNAALVKSGGVVIPETAAATKRVINDFAQSLAPEGDDALKVGFGNLAVRFADKPLEAAQFFGKLQEVRRPAQMSKLGNLERNLSGHELAADITTGSIYAGLKDAPHHLIDELPATAKLVRGGMDEVKVSMGSGVRDIRIKASNNILNAREMQASYFYASSLPKIAEEIEISASNLPLAERAIEEIQLAKAAGIESKIALYDADGNLIDDVTDALVALKEAKVKATAELAALGETPENIAARLNVSTKFLLDPNNAEVSLRSVTGKISGKESIADFIQSPRIVAVSYDIGTRVTKSGKELPVAFKRVSGKPAIDVFNNALLHTMYPERLVTKPVAGATTAIYEAEAAAYISNVLKEGSDMRALASVEVLPQLSNEGVLVSEAEVLDAVQQASRALGSQTLVKSADNLYGSIGAIMQKIGSFSKRAGDEAKKQAQVAVGNAAHQIANNPELGVEWQLLQTKLRSSPGNYVLDPAGTGKLLRQDIAINEIRAKLAEASGKKYIPVDAMEGDAEIAVSKLLFDEVLIPHTTQNNLRLGNRVTMDNKYMPGSSANKALEAGLSPVYHIPVDTTKYSHFLFVQDKSRLIGNGGGTGMLLAKDAEQLRAKQQALESAFPNRFEFVSKENTKSFHKARGEYDYARGMNESFVDSTLRRTGMLADLTPPLNARSHAMAAEEFLGFHQRSAVREVRDAVEMRFSDAFGQLEFLGKQFDDSAMSKFSGEQRAIAEAKGVRNPYRDAINMALDKGSSDEFPLWRQGNAFVERFGDGAFNAVRSSWDSLVHSPLEGERLIAEVTKLNKAAEAVGLEPLYTEMAVAQFNQQLPTRPVMRQFIAKAQALINGTMLGADWIQAINNGLGQVMFAAEFRSLIKQIESSAEGAGALAGLAKVKIPGTPHSITSAIKMHATASRAFISGGQVWQDAAKAGSVKANITLGDAYISKHVTNGTKNTFVQTDITASSDIVGSYDVAGTQIKLVKDVHKGGATRAVMAGADYEIATGIKTGSKYVVVGKAAIAADNTVEHIVVSPELQRKGIGTQLLDAIKQQGAVTTQPADVTQAGANLLNKPKQAGWVTVSRDALREEYTQHGLLTPIAKQYHQMLDDITLSAKNLSDVELNTKLESAMEFARKWTGNNVAEEYTRFVAAHSARMLTDAARSVGLIKSQAVASVYWNTAVNRIHGVNIASQRAVIFQGVVGQSIGMFMTYQHNMMQQLFRYAASGDTPAMAALAASQFGLYGAQGLPAFNAVATHLVGNAPGNATHTDPYTFIAKNGGEVAEWVLYGAGSNALGFVSPDLKFNLYSRGDINPRQLTIFPTSVENTVVYTATLGAVKNMIDTVGNIANGAPALQAVLHGIEHNNLNRPLSGLGSVLQGMQTDNAGKWIGDVAGAGTGNGWDKLAISNFVRIAGAKPLDDAAAADAMYRASAYKAKTTADIRELAESMRLAQADKTQPSAEEMQGFMEAYAKRGGNIKNFRAFAVQTYKTANANQVAEFAMKMRDPQAQHVAAILGATQERAWLGEPE